MCYQQEMRVALADSDQCIWPCRYARVNHRVGKPQGPRLVDHLFDHASFVARRIRRCGRHETTQETCNWISRDRQPVATWISCGTGEESSSAPSLVTTIICSTT